MFKGIKVGDIVIAHTWSGSFRTIHKYKLCKVTKVNKKTFKVDTYPTMTFTIEFGSIYGGNGWERTHLLKYDAEFYEKKVLEQKQEELRRNLLRKVRNINYEELTTIQLERIVKIVEENKLQEVG